MEQFSHNSPLYKIYEQHTINLNKGFVHATNHTINNCFQKQVISIYDFEYIKIFLSLLKQLMRLG